MVRAASDRPPAFAGGRARSGISRRRGGRVFARVEPHSGASAGVTISMELIFSRLDLACAARHSSALRPSRTSSASLKLNSPAHGLSSPRKRGSMFRPHGPATLDSCFRGDDIAAESSKVRLGPELGRRADAFISISAPGP